MSRLLSRWRAWCRYRGAVTDILDAGYEVSPQTRRRLLREARDETP